MLLSYFHMCFSLYPFLKHFCLSPLIFKKTYDSLSFSVHLFLLYMCRGSVASAVDFTIDTALKIVSIIAVPFLYNIIFDLVQHVPMFHQFCYVFDFFWLFCSYVVFHQYFDHFFTTDFWSMMNNFV